MRDFFVVGSLKKWLWRYSTSDIRDYGIAIASVTIAVLLKLFIEVFIQVESPFLLMFGAVIMSALYGGLRAGVLATVSSAFLSYYLFLAPTYTFIGKPLGQNVRVIIFLVEALFISKTIANLKVTQRRLKHEQLILKNSEERNRLMVEAVQDYAIFMLDPEGYVASWNQGAQRIKHYRADEVIGQHFSRFYPPEEVEQGLLARALETAATTGQVEIEGWHLRKDGSRFWAYVSLTALRDERGVLQGFSNVTHDRTILKQATAEREQLIAQLQQERSRLEAILEQMPVGVVITEATTGKMLFGNQEMERIFRHPFIAAEQIEQYQQPTSFSRDRQLHPLEETVTTQTLRGEEVVKDEEMNIQRGDGTTGTILTSSIPLYNSQGEIEAGVVTFLDITERRQAALALQESNAILRAINTSTSTMIFVKDLAGRMVMVNPSVLESLGKSEAEVIGKTDAEYLLNPEQAELIRANDRWVIETGQTRVYEETVDLPAGRRYYLSTKSPYQDVDGQIIGIIGVATDISDRKRFEESLAAKNYEITNILDSITDGFVSLDQNWKYTYVNSKAEEHISKKKSELLGNSVWEVFPEAIDLPTYAYFHQAVNEQITIEYEEFYPFLNKWMAMRLYPSAKGLTLYFQDITERKQAEMALEQSEERFRSAILNAPLPIMLHSENGEVLLVNEAWTKFTGYTLADIPTLTDWTAKAYRERQQATLALIQEVYQQGKPFELEEFLVNTKFGTTRLWNFHSAPLGRLPDGRKINIAMSVDVTERKQAENALRDSEQRFRSLADSMPQLVWAAQPDGTVDYFNRRIQEFNGFSQRADGGWEWHPVLHPEDQQRTLDAWSAATKTGQIYECEHRVQTGDGEFRWYLSRAMPVKDEQGQIIRWYGTATDIHTQKQSLAEREELLQREQAARSEAEAASRMKDEFLATLSHELRTPMNAMLGWTVMLRTRKFDEAKTARALETIERNTRSLHQLIEDILDISRIMRGKLHLDMRSLNLVSILEAALDTVKATAQAKQIQIRRDFEPELTTLDQSVWGEPTRLQQIFWNLLANAIKFTPQGGSVEVRLAVVSGEALGEERDRLAASLSAANSTGSPSPSRYAQVQIRDTGIGIAPEFLPYVFERFRQEDGSITRSHGGLGLGLAIVRQLVELHSGIVQVKSAGTGQGATFTVYLPLTLPHPVAPLPTETLDQGLSDASNALLRDLRILVVDDELDTQELLTVILQDCGAQVTVVASAQAAFETVPQWQPDVLISDIGMPGEDGYGLIRRLRGLPASLGGTIPAIALTAYASHDDAQKALIAGFHQHIAKPINPAELIQAITELVGVFH